MIRRHRNTLVKFTICLVLFYFLVASMKSPAVQSKLDKPLDSLNSGFGEVIEQKIKVPDPKDVVIEAPAVGPRRDLNIPDSNLKELIEDKIVKEDSGIDKPNNGFHEKEKENNDNSNNLDADIEERKALGIPDPKKVENAKVDNHELNNAVDSKVDKEEPAKALDSKLKEAEKKAEEQPALQPPRVRPHL